MFEYLLIFAVFEHKVGAEAEVALLPGLVGGAFLCEKPKSRERGAK